jgi:hypothetical protein
MTNQDFHVVRATEADIVRLPAEKSRLFTFTPEFDFFLG